MITILGIDPGLESLGYAVVVVDAGTRSMKRVVTCGVLQTKKSQIRTIRRTSDYMSRSRELAIALRGIVQVHQPSILACEMSATTPRRLPTFANGVAMGLVASLLLPLIEVLPKEIKKAVCGSPTALKADMIRWALRWTAGQRSVTWPKSQRASKLGLTFDGKHVSPLTEHQADALAVVYPAVATEQFHLACAMAGQGDRG